jgi:SGNH domain (fused to AT3 domains)
LFDAAVHADPFEYDEMLKGSLAEIPGVKYISLLDIICPGKQCQHFDAAGWPILIDDSHLSVAASYDLVERIAERIEIGAWGNTQPLSH